VNTGSTAGFSLIETVLALGIFAFCIVVILGLLGVGLTSARGVTQENTANILAESIYGAWQAQRDKTKPLTIPNMATNLDPIGSTASDSLLFDGDGRQTQSQQGAAMALGYTNTPSGVAGTTLSLTFRWPVGAVETNQRTRTFSQYISFAP
jgi:uncharacterized protein (TIGR02598 family)